MQIKTLGNNGVRNWGIVAGWGEQAGDDHCPCPHGKCSINVINANLIRGSATNNTQISPGLTLKNPAAKWAGRERQSRRERERERERERGPLSQWWHQDAGISAWQLAPGMGSQRPQQLPAFSDLWLYDKWRLHFTICNPPVCVSRQYRARPDTGRPISDFNLVPLRRVYLPLMTANWYKPEMGRALIDLFSLRGCSDRHLIQICTWSTFIWAHIM